MQTTPEQAFFRWCAENGSNFADVLMLGRAVCKKWNAEIAKTGPVYKDMLRYSLYKLLYYDKGVYDEHHVRRLIVLKKLATNYNFNIIPVFAMIEDDLNDTGEVETTIVNHELPLEFRTFLELYREFPSDKVRIYSPEFMNACARMQGTLVRNAFLENGVDDVNKMITIHPLCYSKHYKGDITDIQYINVLCYLNVIGEYGEPTDDYSTDRVSRYFILILELDNLQDDDTHRKLLMDQIRMITSNVYMNWDYLEDLDLQLFTGALEMLIKQQKFNL